MRRLVALFVCVLCLLAVLVIKRVHPEGDHVTLYVIAPVPSLQFDFVGGEEGQWRRDNPTGPEPWWLAGKYLIIFED